MGQQRKRRVGWAGSPEFYLKLCSMPCECLLPMLSQVCNIDGQPFWQTLHQRSPQ